MSDDERPTIDDYEYLRVKVTPGGEGMVARIEYKPLCEGGQDQTLSHEENVEEWTDDDLAQLAFDLLAISGKPKVGEGKGEVDIIWD